ncbi:hypothetical protein [Rasiella sp. SM2506]|uniref:hypothetical protein n=1 Tax=Rasiella sp. SM2506 TaxID=3423914 RepID=UPI003D7AD165
MKTFTSLFVLLFCFTMVAQKDMASVEAQVADFTSSLENRNIDKYFTTMRYCNGETQMFVMPDGSRCFSQGTYAAGYVVWMEEEETMIKKIDNCGMFASVALSTNELFEYYTDHVEALQQNKVKPYEIANREGGPILRTEIKDCHRKYKFVEEATEGMQEFKPFDLTNEAREKNINFDYNKELAVTALETMMDNAIAELEASAAYMRM